MKRSNKSPKVKMAKIQVAGFLSSGNTSCPSGVFDSAAPPDSRAAIIRNGVWANNHGLKTWDSDYAAAPQQFQVTSVNPDKPQ